MKHSYESLFVKVEEKESLVRSWGRW